MNVVALFTNEFFKDGEWKIALSLYYALLFPKVISVWSVTKIHSESLFGSDSSTLGGQKVVWQISSGWL